MNQQAKSTDRNAFTKDGASEAAKKRSENMTPIRRSEIAKKAAEARWNPDNDEGPIRAEFSGTIVLAGHLLPCAVLNDKRRVLSERGLAKALGSSRGGSHWLRMRDASPGEYLPVFLSAANLAPFISPSLKIILSNPVRHRNKHGGSEAYGIPATVIPDICDVFLHARQVGALTKDQLNFANAAETIVSGLARVGIIALVDEATGYQEVRERTELQQILEAYISPELLPWTRRFPPEFYKELFRLRGWLWNPMSVKRPVLLSRDTAYIIYERLPVGVWDTLKEKNPIVDGRRRKHHHRFLTEDIGNPHLEKLVAQATVLMRISPTMDSFKRRLEQAIPKPTPQGKLDIDVLEEE